MDNDSRSARKNVAVLHGAGYAGHELIRILLGHPQVTLDAVTSRTFANRPLHLAHPDLRGATNMEFSHPGELDPTQFDSVFIAAEHGKSMRVMRKLMRRRFAGAIIDLSADFRLRNPALYRRWYGFDHSAPELIPGFDYGLTEINAPYSTRHIANPGCFATGIALALRPLQDAQPAYHAAITAVTGASGSGTRPKKTTHFPTRDGNMRAYKVLSHQHMLEVKQLLHPDATVSLVPVSGPWTRGIWGTVHIQGGTAYDMAALYDAFYGNMPLVRLWPESLPELRYSVGTPFCDIGWIQRDDSMIIGFALDNLLKGAASQAVQNLNAVLGLSPTAGLLPPMP